MIVTVVVVGSSRQLLLVVVMVAVVGSSRYLLVVVMDVVVGVSSSRAGKTSPVPEGRGGREQIEGEERGREYRGEGRKE